MTNERCVGCLYFAGSLDRKLEVDSGNGNKREGYVYRCYSLGAGEDGAVLGDDRKGYDPKTARVPEWCFRKAEESKLVAKVAAIADEMDNFVGDKGRLLIKF